MPEGLSLKPGLTLPCLNTVAFTASSFACTGSWGPITYPHFHAHHGDDEAVYGLDPIELLAGSLPRRQASLVEAWAELHQSELVTDWGRLQAGSEPLPIDPLP